MRTALKPIARRFRAISIIAGFSGLALSSAVGQQETFQSPTYAVFTAEEDIPQNGAFVFPQFNPALGTLQSVTISMSGSSDLGFFLWAQNPGPVINGILTATTSFSATENNATAALSVSGTEGYSVDYRAGLQGYGPGAGGSGQTTFTDPGTLADFTGSGSIDMYGHWGFGVTFSNPDPNLGYSFWQGDAFLSGAVTYDYVKMAPEPPDMEADLRRGGGLGMPPPAPRQSSRLIFSRRINERSRPARVLALQPWRRASH